MNNITINNKRVLTFSFLCLLISILLIFASQGFPVLNPDSYNFTATSVHYRNTGDFKNYFFRFAGLTDPTHENRHLHYPPLFSLFCSLLIVPEDPLSVFIALFILNIACLLLFALLLYPFLKKGEISFLFFLLAMISLSAFLLGNQGRPEVLSIIFLLSGSFAFFNCPSWFNPVAGLVSGCLLCTGLVSFLYGSILLLLAFRYLKFCFFPFLLSFVLAVSLIFIWFPYQITELLKGIAVHTQYIRAGTMSWERFIFYHLGNKAVIGYFFAYLVSLYFYCRYFVWKKNHFYESLLFLLPVCLTLFSFRALGGEYNLYSLFPFFVLVLVHAYRERPRVKIFILVVLFCCTLSFWKHLFLFVLYMNSNFTFQKEIMRVNDFTESHPKGKWRIDPNAFIFFSNHSRLCRYDTKDATGIIYLQTKEPKIIEVVGKRIILPVPVYHLYFEEFCPGKYR